MLITIIIPVFNESVGLKSLYRELIFSLKDTKYRYEILFVDDGSCDDSLDVIMKLAGPNQFWISIISFSKNYGHQVALRAGYQYANGDAVVCIDADLQHPPHVVKELIDKFEQGYDIVSARREESISLSFFKKITSRMYYFLWSFLTGVRLKSGSSDFRLVTREVADAINQYNEQFLFIRGLIPQLGYRQCEVVYSPSDRYHGESKYTLKKMLDLSRNGIMWGSLKPLRFATLLSFFTASVSLSFGLYSIYSYFFTDGVVKGWASTVAIVSFVGSLQLLSIGILGEYIGQSLNEVRSRPQYHIKFKRMRE